MDNFCLFLAVYFIHSTNTEAHIPPKNTFALATQRKRNWDKQYEMYMPNASPNARGPNAICIPPARPNAYGFPYRLNIYG